MRYIGQEGQGGGSTSCTFHARPIFVILGGRPSSALRNNQNMLEISVKKRILFYWVCSKKLFWPFQWGCSGDFSEGGGERGGDVCKTKKSRTELGTTTTSRRLVNGMKQSIPMRMSLVLTKGDTSSMSLLFFPSRSNMCSYKE